MHHTHPSNAALRRSSSLDCGVQRHGVPRVKCTADSRETKKKREKKKERDLTASICLSIQRPARSGCLSTFFSWNSILARPFKRSFAISGPCATHDHVGRRHWPGSKAHSRGKPNPPSPALSLHTHRVQACCSACCSVDAGVAAASSPAKLATGTRTQGRHGKIWP
ncbi:uncharacterized protein CLUP02_11975 [Colletotrichum lupini]|uniref:Uncharacterized protein n=1 Tax=Colletotrichum lupini TaxID=145971 RepID=A0A9Q8SZG6_9PEZI|nr:uncharacterized protein CLUP02_11975 [Colletotrichum lupini]KAK1703621.1 hypothetical protein BDP67DRAFT_238218 [Colletotrichum lupini]UQC86474.1 hypothetical protein CLUP02_11975 [Colletotrichum lupini]